MCKFFKKPHEYGKYYIIKHHLQQNLDYITDKASGLMW